MDFIFGFPILKLAGMLIFEFLTQIHHQKLNFDPFYPFMPKYGNMTVTAGGQILRISKNWLDFWIPHPKMSQNATFSGFHSSRSTDIEFCLLYEKNILWKIEGFVCKNPKSVFRAREGFFFEQVRFFWFQMSWNNPHHTFWLGPAFRFDFDDLSPHPNVRFMMLWFE